MPTPTPRLAILGPLGTYSHQVAHDTFSDGVTYHLAKSIADVFRSVSPEIPFALLPRENSIFGAVAETFDLLRLPAVGETVHVRGQVQLAVEHCLVVRAGVKIEDITRVISHEQALGQCSRFLSERLPEAELTKEASTGLAARLLANRASDDPERGTTAVICSKICTSIFDGLEVLFQGIQNEKENYTRFFILSYGLNTTLPYPTVASSFSRTKDSWHALIRLVPSGSGGSSAAFLGILQIIAHNTCLISIDRRAALGGRLFEGVYFIELEECRPVPTDVKGVERSAADAHYDSSPWQDFLERNANAARSLGANVKLLGVW